MSSSGITINSNLASLQAQRQLAFNSRELEDVSERLASGMRINRASDDAAGLSISSSLRVDSRVYSQGVRNVSDAVSALSIAGGALEQLESILERMKELCMQTANGTLTRPQRSALDAHANALVREYNRIVETTKFNERNLIDGSVGTLTVQAGYGDNGALTLALGTSISRAVGTGTFSTPLTVDYAGSNQRETDVQDVNGDGIADLLIGNGSFYRVLLGNGNGTFRQTSTYSAATSVYDTAVADFNHDGITDIANIARAFSLVEIRFGTGGGYFGAKASYATVDSLWSLGCGDLDGDGNIDLVSGGGTDSGILFGNADGTFRAPCTIIGGTVYDDIGLIDLNDDMFAGSSAGR